ncbi:MAG: hypothetical protein HY898_34535 [Deltaproteobacteria bacterium]|nr:hypothetical protein [Deltaproteobacteria bacterium]
MQHYEPILAAMLRPIQIPPPANWQDFETLCHDLWRDVWQDDEAQKNGRSGQPQCGVDIFGRPGLGAEYAGVQCKGKDRLTAKRLTSAEMNAEVKKAKRFQPRLNALAFATTAPRDEGVQEAARKITAQLSKRTRFTLSVWSWDDISDELCKRPHVLQRHYPQFFQRVGLLRILALNVVEFDYMTHSCSEEDLFDFFGSPAVRALFSEELRLDMQAIVAELVLNASSHGGARWCSLRIENDRVTYRDDGGAFNPLNKARRKKGAKMGTGAGIPFIRYVLQAYAGKIRAGYQRDGDRNVIEFAFQERLAALTLAKNCKIWLRGSTCLAGRSMSSMSHVVLRKLSA